MVSTKKVENLQQVRGIKIWSWEGDDLAAVFSREVKLVSVPLALPDVLTALSTGIVDAAYASSMGILALQWSSKVKYLVDFPVTYSIGGFLISDREWKKVALADQKIVQDVVAANLHKTSEATVAENILALEALRSVGVGVSLQFPKSDIAQTDEINRKMLEKLQEEKILSPQVVASARQAAK